MSQKETVHLRDFMPDVLERMDALKDSFGHFETHESQQVDRAKVESVLQELTDRLDNNFPYFHPQYAAQMLKPPHPVAMAAYMATMMINPNNHSIDGSRATTEMEREVLVQLKQMFGYPQESLGHLTWSGTTANLEALWISREINPGKAVAHSKDSHYTHSRMAEVLNIPSVAIATEADGRMSLEALEAELSAARKSQVKSVDRSERIRTYNFPENRIADHRTGYKSYNLDQVMDGALEPVVQSAIQMDEEARLAALGNA